MRVRESHISFSVSDIRAYVWKKLSFCKENPGYGGCATIMAILTGIQIRLGEGNDLFDNGLSVRRILIPPRNAFECYEGILRTPIENVRAMIWC